MIKLESKYYLEKIVDKYNEMFNDNIQMNEETGIYYFKEIGMQVKSWNLKLENYTKQHSIDIQKKQKENLIKIVLECEHYWFTFDDEKTE